MGGSPSIVVEDVSIHCLQYFHAVLQLEQPSGAQRRLHNMHKSRILMHNGGGGIHDVSELDGPSMQNTGPVVMHGTMHAEWTVRRRFPSSFSIGTESE